MNFDEITDTLRGWIQAVLHNEGLSTLITAAIILLITALVAHLLTRVLKTVLNRSANPLPSYSIFINIGRVSVWIIGVCIILSSCFNVNVSAAVAALGVGGIAISLGFQSTLSNLIGGLTLSLTKLFQPGDRIEVSGFTGIVKDMTWRHTTLLTDKGDEVVIPNSVINTSALVMYMPKAEAQELHTEAQELKDEAATKHRVRQAAKRRHRRHLRKLRRVAHLEMGDAGDAASKSGGEK